MYSERELIESELLQTTEQYQCQYGGENFSGLEGCLNSNRVGIDSIRFVFSGDLGYVCTNFDHESDLCFGVNRVLFDTSIGSDAFQDLGDNVFEFTLTIQDIINARDISDD